MTDQESKIFAVLRKFNVDLEACCLFKSSNLVHKTKSRKHLKKKVTFHQKHIILKLK